MSKTLAAVEAELFDSEVLHAVQATGRLRGTVTYRNCGGAGIYQFRAMASGIANQKATSEDVTPMNIAHSLVACTVENWNAPEYTDIFDQAEVNFSERGELAFSIGEAIGRREDQLCIDAMDAESTPAATVGTEIGGASSDWNVAKIRRATRHLIQVGATGNWHCAISAIGWEALLGQTEFTSSDFNTMRALASNLPNNPQGFTWMGVTWHVIEDRTEGGLPLSGSARTSFLWEQRGQGFAEGGLARRSEVNYVPQKTSWLSNGLLKAGAVSREGKRLVKITTTEA